MRPGGSRFAGVVAWEFAPIRRRLLRFETASPGCLGGRENLKRDREML